MKTAVITGASGSMGKKIIEKLLKKNWYIIAQNNFSKNLILHKNIFWVQSDFSQENNLYKFLESVNYKIKNKKINLIIHFVAKEIKGNPISYQDAINLASINLIAPYYISENLYCKMKKNSNIIFISSICADRATESAEFYGATKAGINSLVLSLAFKYAQKQIRVNGISPGIVKTSRTKEVFKNKEFSKMIKRKNPFNKIATTLDIINFILLIINKKANWVTGQVIHVDGGSFLGYGEDLW